MAIFSTTYLITSFLVIFFPNNYAAASVTFNLTHIGPESENLDIVTEGDASYISNNGIQLTPGDVGPPGWGIGGRAKYIRPLHLWDHKSGELASFFTNFTFVIDSNHATKYGGGLTFFLAQNNSVITGGDAMGLPVDVTSLKASTRFVAVRFLASGNPRWDPSVSNDDRVGISISSLATVTYKKWLSNVPDGGVCQAWITYDSVSKKLTVSFTGFENDTVVTQDELAYTVDLRKHLPQWVIFGFSAGSRDFSNQRHVVRSWSFHSSDISLNVKDYKARLIAGVWVTIIFLVVLPVVLWKWKKKKNLEDEEEGHELNVEIMNHDFEMGIGPKRFSFQQLARATGNFADNHKLGEGGFGGVYKGFFKDCNTYVAVKRVSKSSRQGIKEYAAEIRIISRLRHRNLVQLIGWCHENRDLLLVYEFMENGSLDLHLFKEKSLLTWDTRYKIVNGLSSALLYLHNEWEQCILHRDIKSSNVMLDANFNPKLGDFGLAKLVEHEKGSKTTLLAGTMGYMAPECIVTGKVSKESDVFSFGVVALEIASGRKTFVYTEDDTQIRLVEWIWKLHGTKRLVEAADPRLGSDFDQEELKRLMTVGLWCAHPDPHFRPSMRQVIQVLNCETSVPTLPSDMPVVTYSTCPTSLLYGVTSIVQDQLLKMGND